MNPIYPLGLLLALATSCQKDAPDAGLPPATQVGANTGGCLINGERFVATGYGSGLSRIPAFYGGFFEDSLYYIEMSGIIREQKVMIALFIRSDRPNVYSLNQNTQILYRAGLRNTLAYAAYQLSDTGEIYITSTSNTGKLDLTHASKNTGISAGTFEFTAASTFDPSKTITITNGRFDRKQ